MGSEMKADMKKLLTSSFAVFALLAASTAHAQTAPPRVGQAPAAQAPTPPPQAAQTVGNKPSDYVVGPQDVLRITVFDEPTMSGTYRVDNDGSFQYPMLGRIIAAGQRLRDIEQLIKMKLEDGYIR